MDDLQYYTSMDALDYAVSGVFPFLKFLGCLIGGFILGWVVFNSIIPRIFKRPIQNNNTAAFLTVFLTWTLTYTVMKHDRDTVVEILVGCSHIPNAEFIKPLEMCTFPVETESGTIKVSVDKSYNFILPIEMGK